MLPELKAAGIACHFHYQSLHKSAYAQRMGDGRPTHLTPTGSRMDCSDFRCIWD